MVFGERLKQLRLDKGLKQSDLAKLLGVSNVAISHYESGSRKPDPDTLAQISDVFNVTVDNLLGLAPKKEIDLKQLLTSGSMTYGGEEISEQNLKVLARVVQSFLDEDNE